MTTIPWDCTQDGHLRELARERCVECGENLGLQMTFEEVVPMEKFVAGLPVPDEKAADNTR